VGRAPPPVPQIPGASVTERRTVKNAAIITAFIGLTPILRHHGHTSRGRGHNLASIACNLASKPASAAAYSILIAARIHG
jgi:hypothetical protein